MRYLLLLPLLLLVSCANQTTNPEEGPQINNIKEELKKDSHAYTDSKVADSQNSIQQNTSALVAASVGKLTDKITGVEAKVDTTVGEVNGVKAKIETTVGEVNGVKAKIDSTIKVADKLETKVGDVDARLNNQIMLNNEMKFRLDNQIKIATDMEAKLEAQFKLNAELAVKLGNLTAKIDGQAAAQVGLGNRIDKVSTDMTAGRDSINTQFTGTMMWTVIITNALWTVLLLAVVWALTRIQLTQLEGSRQRADNRANNLTRLLVQASSKLEPNQARGLKGFNLSEAPEDSEEPSG